MEEAAVRHLVGPDGATLFIDIIQGAWDYEMEHHGRWYHISTRAHDVWDRIAQLAETALAPVDGIRIDIRPDGRPHYIVRETFALRAKKHDPAHMTRNYPTATQRHLRETGLLGDPSLPIFDIGYKLDAAGAEIEQCLISDPHDSSWIVDLDDLACGEVNPVSPILQFPGTDAAWRAIEPIRIIKEE